MKSETHEELLTVKQAAEILGVAPNTVRAWGAAGKIREHRHPINGYRLYAQADLDRVLRDIDRSISRPVSVDDHRHVG